MSRFRHRHPWARLSRPVRWAGGRRWMPGRCDRRARRAKRGRIFLRGDHTTLAAKRHRAWRSKSPSGGQDGLCSRQPKRGTAFGCSRTLVRSRGQITRRPSEDLPTMKRRRPSPRPCQMDLRRRLGQLRGPSSTSKHCWQTSGRCWQTSWRGRSSVKAANLQAASGGRGNKTIFPRLETDGLGLRVRRRGDGRRGGALARAVPNTPRGADEPSVRGPIDAWRQRRADPKGSSARTVFGS